MTGTTDLDVFDDVNLDWAIVLSRTRGAHLLALRVEQALFFFDSKPKFVEYD